MNLEIKVEELINKTNAQIEAIQSQFKKNKKMMTEIEEKNGEYAELSEDAKKYSKDKAISSGHAETVIDNRKEFLSAQNTILEKSKDGLIEANKKLNELLNERKKLRETGAKKSDLHENNKKIDEEIKKIENIKIEVNSLSQGSLKERLSCRFGQVDKKLHNALYRENKVGNFLWNAHNWLVDLRYSNVTGTFWYFGIGLLATLGIVGIGSALTALSTTFAVGTVVVLGGGILTNTLANIAGRIINGLRYKRVPKIDRIRKIVKGKNVNDNAKFKSEVAKMNSSLANHFTQNKNTGASAMESNPGESDGKDEKNSKIDSTVDQIIIDIGIHFKDEYSDYLDSLYDKALRPDVQEQIKKSGLEEKFSKMEKTVQKGREAKNNAGVDLNEKISRFNELVIKKQYDKATNNELVELEKMNNELMNTYSQMKKNDTGNEATQRIINELEQSIYRYLRTDIDKLKTNEIRKAIGNLESSTNSVYSAMWLKTLKSVLNSRVLKFNEDKAKLSKLLSDVRKILPSRNARYANEHSKNPNSVDISMELSGKLKEIRDVIAGDYGTDLIKTLNEDDKETFELFSSYLGTKLEKVDKEFASRAKVVFEPVDDMGEIFYVGKCSGQYNGKPFELELKFSNLEDITFENIFNEIKKVVPDYRIEDGIHYSVDTKIVKSGRKI